MDQDVSQTAGVETPTVFNTCVVVGRAEKYDQALSTFDVTHLLTYAMSDQRQEYAIAVNRLRLSFTR